MRKSQKKVLTVFGTRPEAIKLAPVIKELENQNETLTTINVSSGQHADLLDPFVSLFEIRLDYDLQIMEPNQTPNQVCSRILTSFEPILMEEKPDLVLVQGDTSTAVAGAFAAFYRRIPVGHVEAGLRSKDIYNPYPEEMNRRLITRLASYHFAATPGNRANLLLEGISENNIFVTGNPIVDSLKRILERGSRTSDLMNVLQATEGLKRLVVTTHRRESFGDVMENNLKVLRRFVDCNKDVALIFPVHPNPAVVGPATSILSGNPRIHLIKPLNYHDFVLLLSYAWLIVSDSGGVQEEAPTLGKPLLILRENTERPEVVESGIARLVGSQPDCLAAMLEETANGGNWTDNLTNRTNPFGDGNSAKHIVRVITNLLKDEARTRTELLMST